MLSNRKVKASLPATNISRAADFYRDKLGLKVVDDNNGMIMVEAGDGTGFIVYERPTPTQADHTVIGFATDDLVGDVTELKGRGVNFEEYDIPQMGIKTEDGVATMDGWKSAWFKDTEGNIISISEM